MGESQELVLRRMLLAATDLDTALTAADVDRGAAAMLAEIFECDEVLRTCVDFGTGSSDVRSGPEQVPQPELGAGLAEYGDTHPAILSYLQPGDDRRPRRISDVSSDLAWRATAAFGEVFRSYGGCYQLSLVTRLSPTRGVGWALTRERSDFSDDAVELARLLLPLLTSLAVVAELKPRAEPTLDVPLTAAELAIVRLLAGGMTARAMARARGVSESTVHKHLTHAYAKLGCHDRLAAVMRARELGLIC